MQNQLPFDTQIKTALQVLPATLTETLVESSSKPLPFMVRTVPPAVLPIEGLTAKISTGKKREMRVNSIFKLLKSESCQV